MTKKHADSIAKSQLLSIESKLGLNDLFGGKMVKYTFRIPFNLREAVKQECKANRVRKGEVRPYSCRTIQKYGWCLGDECPRLKK